MSSPKNHEIAMGSDRSFGLVFAFLFGLIGLYPLLRGVGPRIEFLAIATVFLLLAMALPRILYPLNWCWMRLAFYLAKVMNPLIMGLLYFAVVTPIAVVMRMTGKDFLSLRFDKSTESYWVERDPPGPTPESMSMQF